MPTGKAAVIYFNFRSTHCSTVLAKTLLKYDNAYFQTFLLCNIQSIYECRTAAF